MKYYIAYGSNLSTNQMNRRCPNHKLVGTTKLKDWELEFKTAFGGGSYATISKKSNKYVPVAVFEISESDEHTLDIYEGVNGNHYFKENLEIEVNGKKITAMVYLMNLCAKPSLPSFTYIDVILEGYEEHGFDMSIVDNALLAVK